jgi:hypothetical protein
MEAYNMVMQRPNLVVAQSFGSRAEAELAKTALESAGIDAIIQADSVGGMREHMAWSGEGFQILVREDDVTEARAVLTPPADSSASGAEESSDSDKTDE